MLPYDRKVDCLVTQFKKALAASMGISNAQAVVVMTTNGYTSNGVSNGGSRVAARFHPHRGSAKSDGLKLKKRANAPHSDA